MRILLLVCSTPTGPKNGGTEVVVRGLARRLRTFGIEVHIAGHLLGGGVAEEPTDDTPVHVLPPSPNPTREQRHSIRVAEAPGFRSLLDRLRPDVVQAHGLTAAAINRRHVEIAKEAGIKVVLWHNVPGITCMQHGLLYEGKRPCDGRIEVRRCTHCRLRAVGVPRSIAVVASRIDIGGLSAALPAKLDYVLGARGHTARFKQARAALFEQLDAVRVGANWAYDALSLNGVPERKLHLIRPGVDIDHDTGAAEDPGNIWQGTGACRPVRLIYWGRIHRSKGLQTAIEALSLRPQLAVEFAIFGHLSDDPEVRQFQQQAAPDPRIRFMGGIAPERVLGVLRTADLAIIPSQWHETGPLTVFEARAAGLPIIGADRGGVAELCGDGRGARLFPAENASALAELLAEISSAPELVEEMRASVPQARTMANVADEVKAMYSQILCA